MNRPVVVLGAGGHARVLMDTLRLLRISIHSISICPRDAATASFPGIPVIEDAAIFSYPPESVYLVNGLGSVKDTSSRQALFYKFKDRGYCFASVIHPSAVISPTVVIGEGAQIMAGTVIQANGRIGSNAIINTGVKLDHDCIIGDHAHIAPGVTMSGGVTVGKGTHIGTGAVIIQSITIGENSLVGAGAVIIRDLPDRCVAIGVPAKEIVK